MPTHVGPNISGEENLVFGYNLSDQKNSYLGEPTTNQANTDYARTIQFHNQGSYNNAGTISDAPEKGTDWKKIVITDRGNNFRIAQFPYIIQTYGTTKVYSVEYDFGLTSGYFFYGDGSSGFGVLQDDGRRATARFTPPSPSDWYEALFLGNNTPASGINDTIYYRYYQVEEKSYPTRYTPTSRSSTQGLLDLTGNNTINLTNVSFDSNSQIIFDGTDDQIEILNHTPIIPNTSDFSIEMVVKSDTTARMWYVSGYNGGSGPGYYAIGSENGQFIYDMKNSNGQRQESTGFVSMNTGQIYHIIVTRDVTGLKIFINTTLRVNNTTVGSFNMNETTIRFGSEYGVRQYLDGNIYMYKQYNRVLSSSEVLNNYNNIKRKYGI